MEEILFNTLRAILVLMYFVLTYVLLSHKQLAPSLVWAIGHLTMAVFSVRNYFIGREMGAPEDRIQLVVNIGIVTVTMGTISLVVWYWRFTTGAYEDISANKNDSSDVSQ